MPFGSIFANDFLKLILQAVAIANIADNAGSSPLTNLYISLHTADPGASGNQTTNEVAYTSYAREAVARDTSPGFAISGNVASPAADVEFAASTGGADQVATHFMIGTASSGAGKQIIRGTINPPITISNGGDAPVLTAAMMLTALTT
jgi:hypothetical protein